MTTMRKRILRRNPQEEMTPPSDSPRPLRDTGLDPLPKSNSSYLAMKRASEAGFDPFSNLDVFGSGGAGARSGGWSVRIHASL